MHLGAAPANRVLSVPAGYRDLDDDEQAAVRRALAFLPQEDPAEVDVMLASGVRGMQAIQDAGGGWRRAPTSPEVRRGLTWLRDNWQGDRKHYYWIWTVSKALPFAGNDKTMPEGVFAERIGGRVDPANTPYPEESPGSYFDLATTLMEDQQPDGSWRRGRWGDSDRTTASAALARAAIVGWATRARGRGSRC